MVEEVALEVVGEGEAAVEAVAVEAGVLSPLERQVLVVVAQQQLAGLAVARERLFLLANRLLDGHKEGERGMMYMERSELSPPTSGLSVSYTPMLTW